MIVGRCPLDAPAHSNDKAELLLPPEHDPGPRDKGLSEPKAEQARSLPRPVAQGKSSVPALPLVSLRQILVESREPGRPASAETHRFQRGLSCAYVIHC